MLHSLAVTPLSAINDHQDQPGSFGVDRNGEIILTTDDPVASNGDVLESITIRGEMAYLDSGIDWPGSNMNGIPACSNWSA